MGTCVWGIECLMCAKFTLIVFNELLNVWTTSYSYTLIYTSLLLIGKLPVLVGCLEERCEV